MTMNHPRSRARNDDATTPEAETEKPSTTQEPAPEPAEETATGRSPIAPPPSTVTDGAASPAGPTKTAASTAPRSDDRTAPDRTDKDTVAPSVTAKPAAAPSADDGAGLNRRMEQAVGAFVDDPRRAVREADAVLDEATKRLARVLEERRKKLRDSWHDDNGTDVGTEELRVALTRYRDMTRRLMDVS